MLIAQHGWKVWTNRRDQERIAAEIVKRKYGPNETSSLIARYIVDTIENFYNIIK
jgi:hypothetical protein